MLTEDGQTKLYFELLNNLVDKNHAYRKILEIVDFKKLCKPLHECYSNNNGEKAYPVETAFKCLLIQQLEDLSDRQMERFLKENLAGKLFCGFGLLDNTPDHSYFGKLRDRFGVDKIVELHNRVIEQLNICTSTPSICKRRATVQLHRLDEVDLSVIEAKSKKLKNKQIGLYCNKYG